MGVIVNKKPTPKATVIAIELLSLVSCQLVCRYFLSGVLGWEPEH